MNCRCSAEADWPVVMARLRVEFRILTDLLNRLEYTISDHLLAHPNAEISADLQILDLIIQSTQALESLTASLEIQSETSGAPDLASAAAHIGLKDMVSRLAHGLHGSTAQPDTAATGDVDLF